MFTVDERVTFSNFNKNNFFPGVVQIFKFQHQLLFHYKKQNFVIMTKDERVLPPLL